MTPSATQILLLIAAWTAYGVIHSLLASLGFKNWLAARWPGAPRYYRLLFNALAVVLLLPPVALLHLWRGEPLWEWTGIGWLIANGLAGLAAVGFVMTLRDYDTAEFLGVRQWREGVKQVTDQEHLHLSTFHRFVRHPWYFFGLVILWTRDMDGALLTSAVCITLYFWLGSLLEERKLLVYHGEVYDDYRRKVPGLIPLPGRYLTRGEAEALVKKYRELKRPGTE
ncbi:MAG: hypothetical protein Kow006_11710 [Gammaproteobacteria bacterium]